MTEYTMITKAEERIGQYSSRSRAAQRCRAERVPHRYILTTCYRCDETGFPVPRLCWFVYLDLGFNDAAKRAGRNNA